MHAFLRARGDSNKFEEVFDDIYVPFEFRFETVSLMLYRHSNSFIGVFQKNCLKLLLRNVVIAVVLVWVHKRPTQYF